VGTVNAVVVIPETFSDDLRAGRTAQVQLIVDGSNVSAASDVLSAAQGAIDTLGWNIALASSGLTGSVSPPGIDLHQEALYNQALDSKPYEITAHMAFFTFLVVALTAVMGIVRELEMGTIEQIMITPLTQLELIVGKATGPAIVGFVNFSVMFVMGRLIFNLPMRGSWLLLGVMTLLYLVSEVSVSLMISTVTRTQQQAITIIFVWVMIALALSGFLVPINSLPGVLNFAANALPLQHFIEIVRSVMLRGAGLSALWPHVLSLVALDIVVVTATIFLLRRLGT
jgi:ABC-2 type transport system permease protein